jgi:hypothetical protein
MDAIYLIITVCADQLRRTTSGVFSKRFVAAVRHRRAAPHCAMGGRASELDRGQVAL